jgi:hypothetical protein
LFLFCREVPLNSTAAGHPFSDLPSLLTDFLPTLMIWTFTALLPVLVAYSDRLLGHWTRYYVGRGSVVDGTEPE